MRHEPGPNRRSFLQIAAAFLTASAAGRGTSEAAPLSQSSDESAAPFAAPPIPRVRIGFVGVGGQGSAHVRNMLRVPGAEITAVCDIAPDRVALMQKWVVEAGQKEPTGYTRGPRDFERL